MRDMRAVFVCLVVAAIVVGGAAVVAMESMVISVTLSPKVLAISSAGSSFSAHTDVPYSAVDPDSVALDGIPADYVKPDLRGQLVAKFDVNAIKAAVAPPSATMTLTGTLKDGTPFAGTDTIRVKE